jgi:hypothetical protein
MKWLSREGIHITHASPGPGSIVVESSPDPGKNPSQQRKSDITVQRFNAVCHFAIRDK